MAFRAASGDLLGNYTPKVAVEHAARARHRRRVHDCTATDTGTLVEADLAAHTYADAVAVAAPKPTALAAPDPGAR